VDLLGELLGLGAKLLDLAGDDTNLLLNGILDLLGGRRRRSLVDLVAAGLDNLLVVAAATTVPGEQVGGVRGNVGQSVLGGNGDEVLLELLGGDGGHGVLRVLSGLERQVVGEETSNVGRGHRGTRDGVDGVLGANPGGLDVQAGGEDVSALSVVGEVSTAVIESRGTDSDGLSSSGGRVVASISVVVASSDGEVNTSADSGVDSGIESLGLATTKRHVGNGALEALALTVLGLLGLLEMAGGSELDTLDDVGHGTRAVGSEDLDGIDIGLLGNTVPLTGDGTRAVSAVTVAILIGIAGRDSLAPVSATLKVDVVDVGAGVDDVGIDTLATIGGVEVLVEGTKVESITVRDTGKTPRCRGLSLAVVALVLRNGVLVLDGDHGVDEGVSLDELDVGVIPDLLNDGLVKVAGVALEALANVEGVLQTSKGLVCEGSGALSQLKALLLAMAVDVLDPGVMIRRSSLINVVLELDDVRVRNGLGLDGAEDRSGPVMDGADAERGSVGDSRQGESEGGSHDDETARDEAAKAEVGLRATQGRDKKGKKQADVLSLCGDGSGRTGAAKVGKEMEYG